MAFIIPAGTGMTIADGVADDFMLAVSSGTLIASPYGKVNVVILAGDVSSSVTSATGFADVTGLSFAVVANAKYWFYFFIVYQTVATTTGINLAVNGPASPGFLEYQRNTWQTTTGVDQGSARAYDVAGASASVDAANTNTPASLEGMFSNGANAGTFILRVASEVDTSQVTVKANLTFLLWQRIV